MKKTLIILGLLSILTTTTFASPFISLSYGQSLEDRVLMDGEDEITFQNTKSGKFKIGTAFFPIENYDIRFGGYLGITYGSTDKTSFIYKDNEEEFRDVNWIFNIGKTFALNNYFVLFGGIGAEFTWASIDVGEETYHPFYETNLNLNGGIMMYFYESDTGLIIEYDSAPKTVSAGVTWRF